MEVLDFIQAVLFSLGVLLFAMSAGFAVSLLTVKYDEVDDIEESRIESGFFSGACLIGSGFIAYLLM
ncbi:hypothetical protein [Photobacterium leiognathi]|uniref:hypothetical protein n=1 Tax=Photobacterium leiognathi TaxID=553611 RepID=UPI002982A704|nr:hypothetical protein [Photobacterium leiognathi]